MALIRSLGSGVSAMQSFVKGMEVIGNNIANSKTTAFKRQRVNYSDSFSNTIRDSASGGERTPNLPPVQIGTGVNVSASKTLFDQGSIEATGISSDLAIAGEGFFRVYDAGNDSQFLTRDGSFRISDEGYMTDINGNYLLGLVGGTPQEQPGVIGRIHVSLEQTIKTNDFGQPLDASGRIVLEDGTRVTTAEDGTTYRVDENGRLLDSSAGALPDSIVLKDIGGTAARAVYDSTLEDYVLRDSSGGLIDSSGASTTTAVVWQSNSQPLASIGSAESAAAVWSVTDPNQPAVALVDESDPNQFRLAIQSWSFNQEGDLTVSLNDGTNFVRAKVLLQNVNDPESLVAEGNGLFSGMSNAGPVGVTEWNLGAQMSNADLVFHTANSNGLGSIIGQALETSNTDLTFEFSEMIQTQRAFQAGSRLITVSDEMLQEIINLKR
ncbi:MAG: flagellar hook-basal body complex protein [Verrucomicrobiae bacterium]|nr:flagellar hook-basal body complex protein [Verrucomicrobiae bacterium]